MRLFSKLKTLIDRLTAIWHSRRGELVLSKKCLEDSGATQPKPYRRKLGDTTYLVSAVLKWCSRSMGYALSP